MCSVTTAIDILRDKNKENKVICLSHAEIFTRRLSNLVIFLKQPFYR